MPPALFRVAVLASGAIAALAQVPAFEVASIKPSDPSRPMAIQRSGNRMQFTNYSLRALIAWAYDIHTDRIYKQPGWLDSAHYDVLANAPTDTPPLPRRPGEPTELQRSMQSLLTDRFHLAVHRESKELPLYALVVAKGGPKFKLAEAPDSATQTPFKVPRQGHLIGTQVEPAMLAKALCDMLDRSVQDFTGLHGVFDFTLDWEPVRTIQSSEAPTRPSLFTALQEQLGLKLEPRKGPVEVLVIDHIENLPTAN